MVVITGVAGPLGSFLAETLLHNKCTVIGVDNFSTGEKKHLDKCLAFPDFVFLEEDITNGFSSKVVALVNQRFSSREFYYFHLLGERGLTEVLNICSKTGGKILIVFDEKVEREKLPAGDYQSVILRDVYGPRMNLKKNQALVHLIKAAIFGNHLKIKSTPAVKISPLFISDAVWAIYKAMFSSEKTTRPWEFNGQEVSLSDLIGLLAKKSKRKIRATFLQKSEASSPTVTKEKSGVKELNWRPKVSLEEGIGETLAYFKELQLPKEKEKLKVEKTKPAAKYLRWGIGVLGVLILAPWLIIALFGFLGLKEAVAAKTALQHYEIGKFSKKIARADFYFNHAYKNWQLVSFVFKFTNQKKIVAGVEGAYYVLRHSADGALKLSLALEKGEIIAGAVIGRNAENPKAISLDITNLLESSYHDLSLVEGRLKTDLSIYLLAKKLGKDSLISRAATSLPLLRKEILKAKAGIGLLPDIVAHSGQKTYLILFQNNNELRPTGGFIGSFGLLTFERGKMIDFEVSDVYSADGQLKGHVEPPQAIKEYLGEANWFLRDSNWDPDFPASAKKAAWFLDKEINRSVDGVIAVNIFVVENMLKNLGEVEVFDFQEKISSDNLFERAEYHSEVGFFPGSTQKKEFLGSLARAIFEKIKTFDNQKTLELVKAIYQSLVEKELLVYLNNFESMRVLKAYDWAGELAVSSCPEKNDYCLADYLMIVEANVGVNKANYFVEREVSKKLSLVNGKEVEGLLSIHYRNTSPSETFPGGRYRNYLRILVPQDSQLISVMVDSRELEEEKIDISNVGGKTSFGFLVEVESGDDRIVELKYQLPVTLPGGGVMAYKLRWQKQSGIKDKDVSLEFFGWAEKMSSKQPFTTDINYSTTLVK